MLDGEAAGVSRRRFIGYLIAAPVVVAGADLLAAPAQAAIPTHQPVDEYDLTDFLTDATKPTSHLITVTVNADGTVSFALPRAEVGQGITTAVAMTIADEMDVALDDVKVTLADARPELVWNQLTGGSNSMHSIFTPVRVAAAIAKGQLLQAAAAELGGDVGSLTVSNGMIKAAERADRQLRLADRQGRCRQHPERDREPEGSVAVQPDRHPPAPDRRARHRHRPQAVRDGPRRPERAADDGVPAADDQRHRAGSQQPGAGRGDARGHRRRDHPPHGVRSRWRRGAGQDVRSVHRRDPRARRQLGRRARSTASPTPTC